MVKKTHFLPFGDFGKKHFLAKITGFCPFFSLFAEVFAEKIAKNRKKQFSGREFITNTTDGVKKAWLARIRFEDFAEVENVVVDRAG